MVKPTRLYRRWTRQLIRLATLEQRFHLETGRRIPWRTWRASRIYLTNVSKKSLLEQKVTWSMHVPNVALATQVTNLLVPMAQLLQSTNAPAFVSVMFIFPLFFQPLIIFIQQESRCMIFRVRTSQILYSLESPHRYHHSPSFSRSFIASCSHSLLAYYTMFPSRLHLLSDSDAMHQLA